MKKISVLVVFLTFSVGLLHSKEIKLLTIGNSFSEDAVEENLYELAESEGDTINGLC